MAIVTIRGALRSGAAFEPAAIASVYARLADSGRERPNEVTITAGGSDWP